MKQHNNIWLIGIAIATCICGGLFVSMISGWIIFRYPSYTYDIAQQKAVMRIQRTPITYHFYKDNSWHIEKNELILSQDLIKNIHYIINSWLSFLEEERIMKKKVTVQTTLCSPAGNDLYISFDRNPLSKEASIHDKWMWVEGLLKTMRAHGITISRIHFLVHHQPLQDVHLDFDHPWPLQGYLTN